MKAPLNVHLMCAAMVTCAASGLSAVAVAQEREFNVARVFFELNHTDSDLGFHGKVDGGPWAWMRIMDPRERTVLATSAHRSLRRQGMSEIAFESAEPPFSELPPAAVFARFPAGEYEIEGRALNGEELENEVVLSHVMPAPAVATINGLPAGTQCDPEAPGYDAPVVAEPVVIAWEAVTTSHPSVGTPGVAVAIANYEVVAETEVEVNGESFGAKVDSILPPNVTAMSVPEEFLELGEVYKFEVLARASNDNQTAIESCFVLLDDE